MVTKLPIKLYEIHTTTKIHGETIPTVILASSLQDQPSPRKFGKIKNVCLLSSSSMLVVLT